MKARALFIGMAALAFLTVALALWQVGGPGYARLEREDIELHQDMVSLAAMLDCRPNQEPLPATIEPEDMATYCEGRYSVWPSFERQRPEVEIIYHRDSDRRFRLCAAFHDPTRPELRSVGLNRFNSETGCIERSL